MIIRPDLESITSGATDHMLLSSAECSDLVRTHRLGRLAWSEAAGPQVRPIGYRSRRDGAEIMIGHGGLRGRLQAGQRVVLQLDDLDVETAIGWSVTVHGKVARSATPTGPVILVDRYRGSYWAPGVPG